MLTKGQRDWILFRSIFLAGNTSQKNIDVQYNQVGTTSYTSMVNGTRTTKYDRVQVFHSLSYVDKKEESGRFYLLFSFILPFGLPNIP